MRRRRVRQLGSLVQRKLRLIGFGHQLDWALVDVIHAQMGVSPRIATHPLFETLQCKQQEFCVMATS